MTLKIGVVHTVFGLVDDVKAQFKRVLPEAEIYNIVDDSLIAESLAHKGVTPAVTKRMADYHLNLQSIGCACVLNTCSTVGEAAEDVAKLLSIPVLRIDRPMCAAAVDCGARIALVATAVSTIAPSTRLIQAEATKANKDVTVTPFFVDGAYEALLKENNRDTHDKLVIQAVHKAALTNDAVVLAQGTMFKVVPKIGSVDVPVFYSMESGIAQVKNVLGL